MGRSPCCFKEGLKKGPWTQEEDEKLIAFVTQHGHGNWRALPKKSGLLRCGKSCRLRWNNYLRPDIKRGLFTPSEEQKIIQLHALVGNKWAFIASQLPKRTDNEIKNYWNTVLKKRLEKLGMSSLISVGAARTDRKLIRAAETAQRQDNENNKTSSSALSKSKHSICTKSASVMSCTHLAQWENARLEAEARLAKESQSSKTHKLFSFAYMGHSFSSSSSSTITTTTTSTAFSSFSNHTHTNHHQAQLPQCSIPSILLSGISNPCLIHHPSIMNPLSNVASSSSLHPSISSCSASNSSSTSSSILSSKSLASQESIALAPSGRLSWQTKELSFNTTSPCISHTSQSSLISQLLCQIERDHGGELQASTTKEGLDAQLGARTSPGGPGRVQEQLNLEATSSINSTMESSKDLNSTMENWHDFIFDVENSFSDVISTNWKGPILVSSPQREEFTHDSAITKSETLVPICPPQSTLDLEGLNLFHFDHMSCEHYIANQHTSNIVLMKELLWDTSTTLSTSSTSIVN